jgi:hypothetical protein
MKAMLLSFFLVNLAFGANSYAHDLSLKYSSSVKDADKKVMEAAMEEVAGLLPAKLKANLPKNIEIKIAKLSDHKVIPTEVCKVTSDHADPKIDASKEKKKGFIYGMYQQLGNSLTINIPVLSELAKGKDNSTRINCQHKSLYEQAIATIVHELTHAYDFNSGRISNSAEFIRRAGFKKGLMKVKSKNLQAMRSADTYEMESIAESFAVNMEYFTMDPEFMCRKPSMFDYYKRLLGADPYPNRNCKVSNTIMLSSQAGYVPTELDPRRVYRIDYLLASAGKGIMSGFGHTMFRIIICAPERFDPITNRTIKATPFGPKCVQDRLFHMVVSYRANVDDGKLDYWKGLTGGYPSILFLLNFNDVLDEYNRDELRDIMSYPLNLSTLEREDFIARVKEEHWNYRGAYKFINNNCAVESYDLLKSALNRNELEIKSSVTPNGVLEDLDAINFVDMNDMKKMEMFKAKTEQIVLAYNKAYGYKLKSDKANKDAVLKFIDESTAAQRMVRFNQFQKTQIPESDANTELTLLKDRSVTASSFSVMEQQILRTLSLKYRKAAADMFMNSKDEKVKEMIKETGAAFAQSFTDLSKSGYGIPLDGEMVTERELSDKIYLASESLLRAEKFLRETMPNEFATLDGIFTNINIYNKTSLALRFEYRAKLEAYIDQVLRNLTKDDFTREIMVSAANGDAESIKKVREFIGKDIITTNEMLDSKLIRLIKQHL